MRVRLLLSCNASAVDERVAIPAVAWSHEQRNVGHLDELGKQIRINPHPKPCLCPGASTFKLRGGLGPAARPCHIILPPPPLDGAHPRYSPFPLFHLPPTPSNSTTLSISHLLPSSPPSSSSTNHSHSYSYSKDIGTHLGRHTPAPTPQPRSIDAVSLRSITDQSRESYCPTSAIISFRRGVHKTTQRHVIRHCLSLPLKSVEILLQLYGVGATSLARRVSRRTRSYGPWVTPAPAQVP